MAWNKSYLDSDSAFEEIAFEHIDALYGTALRLTKNHQDAEDLVQDTFLKAYQHFKKFEEGTNFKAWIFKILMNTFINRYHKDQRSPQSISFDKVEFALDEALKDEEKKTILTNEQLFRTIFDDEIVQAIEELPTDYRVAVLLCDIEGFAYKEISEMLNVPMGTVMSRISRGRKMLQHLLLDYAKKEGYLRNTSPEGSAGE